MKRFLKILIIMLLLISNLGFSTIYAAEYNRFTRTTNTSASKSR